MREFTLKDEFHRNLMENFARSTFLIGKHDLNCGEEISLRSQLTGKRVVVAVAKADAREMPLFTEREADAIAGKDPLFMTYWICRSHQIDELDRGVTYVEHSRPRVI